jgi:hypothetical protein
MAGDFYGLPRRTSSARNDDKQTSLHTAGDAENKFGMTGYINNQWKSRKSF